MARTSGRIAEQRLPASIVLVVVACVAMPWAAASQQAEPDPAESLAGRWAVDPGDCQDNRYVWSFAAERAALLVGNHPLGGWRKPSYSRDGELLVVRMDGTPSHELRWRLVRDGELASAGLAVDGRVADPRSFLPWKRCSG